MCGINSIIGDNVENGNDNNEDKMNGGDEVMQSQPKGRNETMSER